MGRDAFTVIRAIETDYGVYSEALEQASVQTCRIKRVFPMMWGMRTGFCQEV